MCRLQQHVLNALQLYWAANTQTPSCRECCGGAGRTVRYAVGRVGRLVEEVGGAVSSVRETSQGGSQK
jgi:hypothetical protein